MSLPWETLGWVTSWVLGGAVFVLLVRRGVTYVDHCTLAAAYFALASLAVGYPFRGLLIPLVKELRPLHAIEFGAVLVIQVLGYWWLGRRRARPTVLIETHPHVYWLRLDQRYHVSKPFEILFQQVLFVALVLLLAGAGWPRWQWNLALVALFGLLHVPIIPLVGRYFGLYYLGSSIVAAAIFPALILARPDGFVYCYLLHWLYYLVSTIFFWTRSASASGTAVKAAGECCPGSP